MKPIHERRDCDFRVRLTERHVSALQALADLKGVAMATFSAELLMDCLDQIASTPPILDQTQGVGRRT